MLDQLIEVLTKMRRNPIQNYVVPELTSSLIGGEGKGQVRLFESDRNTREFVTPHSHRFDFVCLVLAGHVVNITYTAAEGTPGTGRYARSRLDFRPGLNESGALDRSEAAIGEYKEERKAYQTGEVYAMTFSGIHSIQFSRDAKILFFEGPTRVDYTFVLEPVSTEGVVIPTFRVEPWMFQKDAK